MSGMTDADYLDAIANGRYQVIESAAHHKERLRHIAARLRGDGEQSDAVRTLPAKWRASIDAASPHRPQDLRPIRFVLDLETALSTQPAPSEQVAASVAVPDEATIDRLAHEAYEIHCNTPIGHFPNDSKFPKWRAVVRHVLATAPAAPTPGPGDVP